MKQSLFLFIICFPVFCWAQNIEVGFLLGASGYQGDLSPGSSKISVGKLHPSLGVFGRFNQNRHLSYRGSFSFGTVSASDANSNDESRKARNLSFRSKILELGITAEYNILGRHKRLSPFIFGGIAFYNFKPEANYQGNIVELQPLGTEGQGMDGFPNRYKLSQISIPMGAGLKYALTPHINIGLELGLRKLFTDYLDDVSGTYVNYLELVRENGETAALLSNRSAELTGSDPPLLETGTIQRGNSDSKDWYFISALSVSYNLWNDKDSWSGNYKRGEIGCPVF